MVRQKVPKAPQPPAEQWVARLSFAAGAALVLLVPLVWHSQSVGTFRQPKSTLALILWAVLAATFLVRNRFGAAWRDPWWLAWSGVLAGGLMSCLASRQPLASLACLLPVLLAALGFGALRQLTERQRQRLLSLVLLSGVLQGTLTLLYLQPRWQPEAYARIPYISRRYAWIGTMGNPADVAILLALPTLLAAALALARVRRRPVMATTACFLATIVIATRTMSVLGALGLAALVLIWRLLRGRRRIAATGVLLAALLLLATAGPYRSRVAGALRDVSRRDWMAVGSARGAGFSAGLSMLTSHPVLGVGFGQFEANSFRYMEPDVLARRGRVLGLRTAFGQAHNEPLQHAAETGLAGILLAALGIALAIHRSPSPRAALPGSSALLAAGAIICLAQFPLHQAATAAQWTVIAALALPPLVAPPTSSRRRATWQLAAVLLVAALASFGAWQRHRAAVAVKQGEALASLLGRGQATGQSRELARVAHTNLEARLPWVPSQWRARAVLGGLALEAGDPQRAVAHFSAALERAERPEIRLNLGLGLLAAGDREAALTQLEQAMKLNPAFYFQIRDRELAHELRQRLEADGFGQRHSWMFEPTEDRER